MHVNNTWKVTHILRTSLTVTLITIHSEHVKHSIVNFSNSRDYLLIVMKLI